MRVIIVGCGRLGLGLAQALDKKGNTITVIDKEPHMLEQLPPTFKGKTLVGIGFDKKVLESAQIDRADAVVACTAIDETNALIARISRNIYKVPRAIARLYDSRKAVIYNTLGVQTISTTAWGIEYVSELLSYNPVDSVFQFGSGGVEIIRIETPFLLVGRSIREIGRPGEAQVVALRRSNKTTLPTDGTILQKDDVLFVAVASSSLASFKKQIGLQ